MKQSYYSPKLARYIGREFLIPLVCCLMSFSILFLIIDLFDVLSDFLKQDAPVGQALEFFIMSQPHKLVVVMPMAFLLAAMYTFANFSRHNEIVAIKASGISVIKSCRYIWGLALIGALCQGLLHEFVVPFSAKRAAFLEQKIDEPDLEEEVRTSLAYHAAEFKRDWVFANFDLNGRKTGVVVTQFRPNQSRDWELRADKVEFKKGEGWIFYDGQLTNYDIQGRLTTGAAEHFRVKKFSILEEKPEMIHSSLKPVPELSSRELWKMAYEKRNLPESTRDLCMATMYERIYWPFGCIIAVLVAIPLSIISGRGGMFVNIGTAVGMMLSYYASFQLVVLLAKKGWIPAGLGLFAVTAAAITGGCVMLYRKR